MADVQSQQGLVGLFDILGYRNFLRNNPIARANTATQTVLTLLSELPEKAKERIVAAKSRTESSTQVEQARRLVEETNWVVLSDTIVLSIPFPREGGEWTPGFLWECFLLQSVFLYRMMFEQGLPVRGAIAWGDFMISKTGSVIAFAGQPLIDAYECAHMLELSAVIVAKGKGDEPSADSKLREILQDRAERGGLEKILFEYLVPLKEGQSYRQFVLSPNLPEGFNGGYQGLPQDIRQHVVECFWKHEKDIPPGELPAKVLNTEMFLRFVKMQS
ncbi:MAG: hypothetical protein GXP25_09385 [Planctomycetes bacterium]|nr:hypothetical protein [Planctomycetota bacterium]